MSTKTKFNSNDIRSSNISLVLRTIKELAPISRADISKKTNLTRAATSSLVDELISLHCIEEIGLNNQNTVGKKATLLDIRTDKIFAIAVNFSGNDVFIAKIDMMGSSFNLVKKALGTLPAARVFEELTLAIKELIEEINSKRQIFIGIGVAFPGPVHRGKILYPASFKALENYNLYDILSNEFKCPVYIENNADAAALAESWFGKYYNLNSFVFILIDQGIGCGIVINNQLYYGHDRLTSEFGHTIIKTDGAKCFCGNNGCLSALASDYALIRTAPKELLKDFTVTKDKSLSETDLARLMDKMKKNMDISSPCIEEIAYYLGVGIGNMVSTFTPDVILIEGNLVDFPFFIDKVTESVGQHVHPLFKDSFRIRRSQLGKAAPLIGAGTFLFKDLYFNPFNRK